MLNSSINNMGIISKNLMESRVCILNKALEKNKWRNTADATEWFSNINNKWECTFLQFDICTFYTPLTEDLLIASINLENNYGHISDKEVNIMRKPKKKWFYTTTELYGLINITKNFYVCIGVYDFADTCELVGIMLLWRLRIISDRKNNGIYRDDGINLLPKLRPRQAERVRIFKDN